MKNGKPNPQSFLMAMILKQVGLCSKPPKFLEGLTDKGGLIYENDREGNHHEYEYEWWVQAEAVVGYLNAFVINRDPKFLESALKVTKFIEQYVSDKKDGEWFYRVDPEGNAVTSHEKAGFWKCPYHNTRACLEIMHRIEKLNNSAL